MIESQYFNEYDNIISYLFTWMITNVCGMRNSRGNFEVENSVNQNFSLNKNQLKKILNDKCTISSEQNMCHNLKTNI